MSLTRLNQAWFFLRISKGKSKAFFHIPQAFGNTAHPLRSLDPQPFFLPKTNSIACGAILFFIPAPSLQFFSRSLTQLYPQSLFCPQEGTTFPVFWALKLRHLVMAIIQPISETLMKVIRSKVEIIVE